MRGCLAAWMAAGVAGAQSLGSDMVYHVQGQVVNGVTGKPVARALVSLSNVRIGTMSDGEGRFSLEVAVLKYGGGAAEAASTTFERMPPGECRLGAWEGGRGLGVWALTLGGEPVDGRLLRVAEEDHLAVGLVLAGVPVVWGERALRLRHRMTGAG